MRPYPICHQANNEIDQRRLVAPGNAPGILGKGCGSLPPVLLMQSSFHCWAKSALAKIDHTAWEIGGEGRIRSPQALSTTRPANLPGVAVPSPLSRSQVATYCAGMVIKGSLSLPPVSASVKKNITAVRARFVCASPLLIQNQ